MSGVAESGSSHCSEKPHECGYGPMRNVPTVAATIRQPAINGRA